MFPATRAYRHIHASRLFSSISIWPKPHQPSLSLRHGGLEKPKPGEGFKVTYITPENEHITVESKAGQNLLDLAHANNIDLEGACECSLACSTCHVIVDQKYYDKLEEPSDEENDMLDLAFALTDTSRLGCQIKMSRELDGMTVRIPSATRNLQQEKLAGKSS
ncbi:hypothetical protein SmJEL517_g02612 [Synchytrium microbalum]|uniref:2Fe-2S ferredoxin-type domain-containing protein n=1 Tax=Synchytrium microbalum TaxID=1806994 RepID=A0A507C174_9FUNG|nr:uncharacterized protein SmJEL517_g02612 [Synchytrium microbalum]TPX34847.1 hypothetical protein SmJEL517_g02612 [Synchytrium microbalum]